MEFIKCTHYWFILLGLVASSIGQSLNYPGDVWAGKQLEGPNLVEMIMLGLAGIPVYRAVGMLLPLLMGKRLQPNSKDSGRVLNRHRTRRDLAYAQQLLDLLISVETALEKYGVTEPQCQLKATCEIHKRNANAISTNPSQANFIKLVSEMRREIRNPRVVPLAKYVFEYYEEAAERGEQQNDCGEMYPKCEDSMDSIFRRTKGKKSRKLK
ncbi:hypothetical protein HNY73_007984 [Argiope bruennichi]|uniref:Uncharacterized protein n=1 Tax=Argiope bruennichi TaxID=94029 RepID=A0A8T0F5V5_ARGBR|nr:hypothetical protein HNY73_007984 [Argiope bruennichi]